MSNEKDEPIVQAQSIFDAAKLLDKDLIDKILAISKLINIQQLPNGLVRVSIDIAIK